MIDVFQTVVKMEDNRGLCVISKPDVKNQPPKEFTFDGVYFTNSVTEQIYNDLAYPLVEVRSTITFRFYQN